MPLCARWRRDRMYMLSHDCMYMYAVHSCTRVLCGDASLERSGSAPGRSPGLPVNYSQANKSYTGCEEAYMQVITPDSHAYVTAASPRLTTILTV